MKSRQRVLSLAVTAACMALSVPAAAQQIDLKLHHFLGPKSPAHEQMLVPWAERVMKATGGKANPALVNQLLQEKLSQM